MRSNEIFNQTEPDQYSRIVEIDADVHGFRAFVHRVKINLSSREMEIASTGGLYPLSPDEIKTLRWRMFSWK